MLVRLRGVMAVGCELLLLSGLQPREARSADVTPTEALEGKWTAPPVRVVGAD
jgi:hypothetical protein